MNLLALFLGLMIAEPVNQVIGFYGKGKLRNPVTLAKAGPGYQLIFPGRNHDWGSTGLVTAIEAVAASMDKDFPGAEPLQIADLSDKNGGRLSQHASHQNGLDADIVYYRMNHGIQEPDAFDELQEDFVIDGRITQNFDFVRNWEVMRRLNATGRLDRIFVDKEIKKELCKYAKQASPEVSAETSDRLRKLRPYYNHAHHMHVRFTCPKDSPKCKAQKPIEPGDGCDRIDADFESNGFATEEAP